MKIKNAIKVGEHKALRVVELNIILMILLLLSSSAASFIS